jgi:hypothetical protein
MGSGVVPDLGENRYRSRRILSERSNEDLVNTTTTCFSLLGVGPEISTFRYVFLGRRRNFNLPQVSRFLLEKLGDAHFVQVPVLLVIVRSWSPPKSLFS